MLGALVKGLGADHVVWGTDAIWTRSPQWQIEALRRLEIPEEMQKKYGFAPMGPADGPVKAAILGGNNARLYGFTPQKQAALAHDKVSHYKEIYERHGTERSNLAYGYVVRTARWTRAASSCSPVPPARVRRRLSQALPRRTRNVPLPRAMRSPLW
jgi:hypothetical protein